MRCALSSPEIDALATLICEALPDAGRGPSAPFATPLLFFARMDLSFRTALFIERAGHLLMQDHLLIECARPIVAGEEIELEAHVPAAPDRTGYFEISARLADMEGQPIAALKAGLRHIETQAMEMAQGLPLDRLVSGETTRARTQPLSASLAARYADLAGDSNSLHRRDDAIVPGAFLAALAQSQTAALGSIRRMSTRFMAPVLADEAVDLVLQSRGRRGDLLQVRVFYASASRGAVAISNIDLS